VSAASSSAQQLRQALGTRLREIRVEAGLTARDLGRLMERHASKISRIEHGSITPSGNDIRAWCIHCAAIDQLADLLASRDAVESAYIEWRRLETSGLRRLQETYLPLYERTRTFRVYHSLVVPGMFQTPGYATALLGAITAFRQIPDDTKAAVAARLARQRLLSSGDHRFAVVLEESVLRYQISSAEVMAGQLGHLITVAALPSVSLGVIPFGVPERAIWPVEGFGIFDDEQVNIELLSARITVTQPREVAIYTKAFTELAGLAVSGNKARALIVDAITALDKR
jgi:transcriptional regulator with XRE-family HTH domain